MKCGKRFTTYEKPEDIHLMVVKKDGRREEFDIDKVKNNFYFADEIDFTSKNNTVEGEIR